MQDLVARDDCSHVAFTGVRQRVRVRRMRLDAPEQRGQLFNSMMELSLFCHLLLAFAERDDRPAAAALGWRLHPPD